jgi:type VI protein secretion system component Hcp/peptidoglycan hydrolase-like protein with peptidoglycan-binding domain
MPEPVFISFKLEKGDYLPGIATLDDNKNLWPGLAFDHEVGNSYQDDTWKGDFIVSFKPITIWLELSSFMPQLYRAMVRGAELDRVEIYWIGAVRHQSKPGLYFKHTLYPVKMTGFKIEMPNVKDKRFERFGHLVKLEMWYRFMEILYVPGHHQKKIEWLRYLGVSREMEKFMAGWEVVEAPERPPVSLEAPGWEHTDESLKAEKEAVVGERIRLLVDVMNIRDGESVKFEICYYNDQIANCNFQTVSGKVVNGTAAAEWTIDYSTIKDGVKAKDKSELYKLRFEPMYSGKYGAKTDIPVRPAKIFCDFVEVADVHFNTGSPLPCLDDKGSLIAALVESLKFAKDNPDKEVVLFGHTDSTGDAADNFDLSGWRAEAVKTLLANDKQRWIDLADGQATITDEQTFLGSLTKRYGWQCDPGPVDGKDGPKTKAGREAFQRHYNETFGGSLTIDGTFGEQSWGAMFEVVRALLTNEYKTATEAETLPALTFANESKGVYPCGESLPIDEKDRDNYRSADNRRVEICFFDKGKCPKLPKHPKKAEPVTKSECPVYDSKRVERRPIEVATSAVDDRYIVFEETADPIDAQFPYEMSGKEAAKKRWIYAFGSDDGKNYSRVWEIVSDSAGKKFATREVTAENYDPAPDDPVFEDVAFLPAKTANGAAMKFLACLSEIRLPKERLFDQTAGIIAAPTKRCADIDDTAQVARTVAAGGEEYIVLVNWLRVVEKQRRHFNEVYETWQENRRASWLEEDATRKKAKLEYEFGSLVLQVVNALPDYKRQLAPGAYPILHDMAQNFETQKQRDAAEVDLRLGKLCRAIRDDHFTQTCADYISIIQAGDSQFIELYEFENRIGEIVEGLTRFPQGVKTLQDLLPHVESIADQSWLQNLLLLKNDLWSQSNEQLLAPQAQPMTGSKVYQHIRKFGDGLTKVLVEGAKAGANVYSPENMAKTIQKVLRTTGEAIAVQAELVAISNPTVVKPFMSVFANLEKNSFWRFRFEPESPYNNVAAKFLSKSKGIENLLLGLEGVALVFTMKEWYQKNYSKKATRFDHINTSLKVLTYAIKSGLLKVKFKGEWIKLGKGPVAIGNVVTASLDSYIAFQTAEKEFAGHDTDAALFQQITGVGYAVSALGYAATVMTYIAGAVLASGEASALSGIGIAPGTLLVFVGAAVSVAGSVMAAYANNTPLEDMLVTCPWGANPDYPVAIISATQFQQQYIKAIRLTNAFIVEINLDTLEVILQIRRLEPETIINLTEIGFSMPRSTDGSISDYVVVGTNIHLTPYNCTVTRDDNTAWVIKTDLSKLCDSEYQLLAMKYSSYAAPGRSPHPDHVRVKVSIDIEGDGVLVVPDSTRKVVADRSLVGKTILKVE